MISFWIGVIITIYTAAFTSLYSIISSEDLYQKYRKFLIWFPFNISIAFFSGFSTYIILSKNNEFGKGIIVILLALLIAFFAFILEKNYFVLKIPWESVNMKKLKFLSFYFYIFITITAIVPYIIFYELTSLDFYVLSSLFLVSFVLLLLYLFTWDKIYMAAETDLGNKILLLLYSFNRFSFSLFNEDDDDTFFLNAHKTELILRLETIEKAREHIYHFDPVLQDGNLLPGFSSNVIPIKTIKRIKNNTLDTLLSKYDLNRAKLLILIGNEVESREGYDIIRQKISIEFADQLKQRRIHLQ